MARLSQDSKVAAIRRAPLFEGLSRRDLLQLVRLAEDLEVEEGKVLCREGQTGREFFVIVEGEADVTRKGRKLRTLSAGDFFGEIALIAHSPRTATVTARTPLRFLVLTSGAFAGLLDHQPQIERKVLSALARRLQATSGDPTL